MRRYRALALGLLLAGLPLAADDASALQEPDAPAAREAAEGAERVRERFSAETARRILTAAEAAAEAGGPRELVYEKALEGAAKGVPAERIVAAVETFAARVGRGARLLGRRSGRTEVSSAAEALGRGVPAAEVRALSGAVPSRPLSVPLLVLADLVELGAPAAEARELVVAALRAGVDDRELLELEAEIRGEVRRGVAPAEAVAGARESLGEGRAPDGP